MEKFGPRIVTRCDGILSRIPSAASSRFAGCGDGQIGSDLWPVYWLPLGEHEASQQAAMLWKHLSQCFGTARTRGKGINRPKRSRGLLRAGHKRPLHTIIPAFMKKGDVKIGFGIMGGWNQAQAHAQFVANIVDFE